MRPFTGKLKIFFTYEKKFLFFHNKKSKNEPQFILIR